MTPDITIDGAGFYQLSADTPKGKRFMAQVQGYADEMAYSDDMRMTEDIAVAALRKGLRVAVNDHPVMLGTHGDVVLVPITGKVK